MNKKVYLTPKSDNTEKSLKISINSAIFHQATPAHGNKNRGVGITRKSKEETKAAKKLAKSQRLTNHAMKNKKFRKTGSNKRK